MMRKNENARNWSDTEMHSVFISILLLSLELYCICFIIRSCHTFKCQSKTYKSSMSDFTCEFQFSVNFFFIFYFKLK